MVQYQKDDMFSPDGSVGYVTFEGAEARDKAIRDSAPKLKGKLVSISMFSGSYRERAVPWALWPRPRVLRFP